MKDNLISRQDAINAIKRAIWDKHTAKDAIDALCNVPSISRNCEGCKHLGKWENEVEYGYPSSCTRCKRRAKDYYER